MYRNTYVKVNLSNLKYNVETLINRYKDYKYYFGVVKADSYGHYDNRVVKTIINGGCNYLAVATLDEALTIRKEINDIPILCLGIINPKSIPVCIENNITITISNIDYLKEINEYNKNLKVHIKINTGMNRLGVNKKDEFNEIYKTVKEKFYLEGIYTHIYNATDEEDTLNQFKRFEEITSNINLNEVPIIHISASEATEYYPKKDYVNGCRLGIAMYGLVDYQDIEFKSTFKLLSEVIQINEVENETVGYNGAYKVEGKERIAVIPIGYADGIIRKNTGRDVYINNKPYKIVGNICMDMLFVKVDDSIKVGDKVEIIKDIDHIKEIANHLDTITYEVICSISKRVPRIYE
ncbi:MAG: alanine racemase [Bacilli bacterium]|nr:alanine racemase [Bacilli bacterium]